MTEPGRRRAEYLIGITVLVAVTAVVVSASAGFAAEDYDLDVGDAIETPSETVSVDGDEYTVNAVVARTTGEDIDVDVTVSEDERFQVHLYTVEDEPQIKTTERGEGPEQVTFETDGMESGNYVLVLDVDGTYEELLPVVIEAYDVSLEHDAEIEVSEDFEATVDVTKIDTDDEPEAVEIALWNDGETIREEATAEGDGSYSVSISSDDLEEGSYDVYAVARGSDTVEGEREILGVNEGSHLEVEDEDDEDGGGGSPGDGSGDDSDSESDDESDLPDNESDGDVDDADNESTHPDNESVDGDDANNETDGSDDSGADDDDGPDVDGSDDGDDDDNSVIEPNTDAEDDTESSDDQDDAMPLLGPALVLFALLSIGLVERVRS